MKNLIPIRKALVSLSNKADLSVLLEALGSFPIDLYSTGGTYTAIAQVAPQRLIRLEDYLNYPEMPGGLVKTLHPRVHGGLLADLEDEPQRQHMQEQGMVPFDLLVVNLYPFADTVAANSALEQCRQQIDIGGVAMLRAGAKNFGRVAVLTDPADYPAVAQELQSTGGSLALSTRLRLAQAAFRHVLEYDRAISQYLDTVQEIAC